MFGIENTSDSRHRSASQTFVDRSTRRWWLELDARGAVLLDAPDRAAVPGADSVSLLSVLVYDQYDFPSLFFFVHHFTHCTAFLQVRFSSICTTNNTVNQTSVTAHQRSPSASHPNKKGGRSDRKDATGFSLVSGLHQPFEGLNLGFSRTCSPAMRWRCARRHEARSEHCPRIHIRVQASYITRNHI